MSSTETEEQRMLRLTEEAAKEREGHIRKSISEAVTLNGRVEESVPCLSLDATSVVQEADPGKPTIEEMSIVLQVIDNEETEFQKDGYLTFNPLALSPPRIPEYTSRFISPPKHIEPGTPEPRHKSPDRPRCCSPLR